MHRRKRTRASPRRATVREIQGMGGTERGAAHVKTVLRNAARGKRVSANQDDKDKGMGRAVPGRSGRGGMTLMTHRHVFSITLRETVLRGNLGKKASNASYASFGAKREASEDRKVRTVSYTHLTLPTI